MRIAVIGAGAVGGYFGAMLARAGHEVIFVARGAQLAALRERGLLLTGPRGDFEVKNCIATDDPAGLAAVDAILFCVKLYDTETAAHSIAPLVKKGGVCISLQNGVDAQQRLESILGPDRTMGGLAMVSGVIAEPGVVRYTSTMSSVVFGEADGTLSHRALAFQAACEGAGFEARVSEDIQAAQWSKFTGLATNAALSCVVRQPAGIVYHMPELVDIARRALSEVAALAHARRIRVPHDVVESNLRTLQSFPADMYASMYHDLRLGRRLELESLSGLIVRSGREFHVPTPVHEFAYAVLKPYVDGAPRSIDI
ncbi:MAG: 2-dehydropantoate 2-reductase [Burkholderiaceae bacterium]|nr:2-dehydropantoate 2-reductase [Burkholderiaceae bacterium]